MVIYRCAAAMTAARDLDVGTCGTLRDVKTVLALTTNVVGESSKYVEKYPGIFHQINKNGRINNNVCKLKTSKNKIVLMPKL